MAKRETDSLALLKYIVITLGVALLAGIILLFVLVYQRHNSKVELTLPENAQLQGNGEPSEQIITVQTTATEAKRRNCVAQVKELPVSDTAGVPLRGITKHVTLDGDLLTMVIERTEEKKESILVVDICKAKLLSHFTVEQPVQ